MKIAEITELTENRSKLKDKYLVYEIDFNYFTCLYTFINKNQHFT